MGSYPPLLASVSPQQERSSVWRNLKSERNRIRNFFPRWSKLPNFPKIPIYFTTLVRMPCGPSPQLRTFTKALKTMLSALSVIGQGMWILKLSRGYKMREASFKNPHPCTIKVHPTCTQVSIHSPRALYSLHKFSKIHTPALFKFIPHVNKNQYRLH